MVTNKAALANLLQNNVQKAEENPSNAAIIFDEMSLVQKVNADRLSFGDVAHTVLNMVLREGSRGKRIDLVFNTYKQSSIKNSERYLRGQETWHHLSSITSTQIVRQWRKQ